MARSVTMENRDGNRVEVVYDGEYTYVYHDGDKVYTGGGDRVDDRVAEYRREGYQVVYGGS